MLKRLKGKKKRNANVERCWGAVEECMRMLREMQMFERQEKEKSEEKWLRMLNMRGLNNNPFHAQDHRNFLATKFPITPPLPPSDTCFFQEWDPPGSKKDLFRSIS